MVEPPRTHLKPPCRPDSPSSKVVRGGSALSNHPELTRNCPVGLIPPASQAVSCEFGVVRRGSMWSNHPELIQNCPVGLLSPASQWFEEVRCGGLQTLLM